MHPFHPTVFNNIQIWLTGRANLTAMVFESEQTYTAKANPRQRTGIQSAGIQNKKRGWV